MDEKEKQAVEWVIGDQATLETTHEQKPNEQTEASVQEKQADIVEKLPEEKKGEVKAEEPKAEEAKEEVEDEKAKAPNTEKEAEKPEKAATENELSEREKEAELKCALALAGVSKAKIKYALKMLDKDSVSDEASAEKQVEELKGTFPELFNSASGIGSEGGFQRKTESESENARRIFAEAIFRN